MNILQTEDIIKGLPDDRLLQEAKAPSGQVPQFLVVSEIQRRQDMRKRYASQQDQPDGTVAEQIVNQAAGGGQEQPINPQNAQPQQGPPQGGPPQGPPQGMPPQGPPQQAPMGMPPQGMPMQQMYNGGIVHLAGGGRTLPPSVTIPVSSTSMGVFPTQGYSTMDDFLAALEGNMIDPINVFQGTDTVSIDPSKGAISALGLNTEYDQDGNMLPTNLDTAGIGGLAPPADTTMSGEHPEINMPTLSDSSLGAAPASSYDDTGMSATSLDRSGIMGSGLFDTEYLARASRLALEPAFRALETDPSLPKPSREEGIAGLQEAGFPSGSYLEDDASAWDTANAIMGLDEEFVGPNYNPQTEGEPARVAEELVTEDPIEAIAAVADSTSSDKYSSGPGDVTTKGQSKIQRQAIKGGGDSADTSGIASLIALGGQKAADVPDIADLIKAQHQAGWSNALMQLGAGIAGNDLSGGLSKAGTAMSAGSKAARDLDLRGRMAQYSAEQKQVDRDIDIYGKVGTLEVAEARALVDQKIQNQRGENEVLRFAQNLINQMLAGVVAMPEEKAQLAMRYARQILPADLAEKFGTGLTEETLGGGEGTANPADFDR